MQRIRRRLAPHARDLLVTFEEKELFAQQLYPCAAQRDLRLELDELVGLLLRELGDERRAEYCAWVGAWRQ